MIASFRLLLQFQRSAVGLTGYGRLRLRHGERLGLYVGIVRDFGCPRGELNRENLVTVLAPKETDIVHLPDAGDATGLTAATRGTERQEASEASLVGGLCHLRASRSSLTAMRAASSSSFSVWNVSRDGSLWRHTGSRASSRVFMRVRRAAIVSTSTAILRRPIVDRNAPRFCIGMCSSTDLYEITSHCAPAVRGYPR